MPFMPVLCSTLGLCCRASWVRGEIGECWWAWLWVAGRLLLLPVPLLPLPPLCSVPGDRRLGQRGGLVWPLDPGPGRGRRLPGLQMGACSTVVVDVRMDLSRSRSRSDEDMAAGFVKCVGPPGGW